MSRFLILFVIALTLFCQHAKSAEPELVIAAVRAVSGDVEATRKKFDQICVDIDSAVSGESATKKARVLFDWMHQHVLTGGYRADCNDICRTLDEGVFNCLTSTILFQSLCEHFDVPTIVVETPGHIRCRLGENDIETTCRDWFSQNVEFSIDPSETAVSQSQLIARIHYNVGLNLAKQKQYELAINQLCASHQLDPNHQPTHDSLGSALNNWSLILAAEKRFSSAIDVLEQAKDWSRDGQIVATNRVHIHSQWIHDLCRRGKLNQAAALAKNATQRFPHVAFYQETNRVLQHAVRSSSGR